MGNINRDLYNLLLDKDPRLSCKEHNGVLISTRDREVQYQKRKRLYEKIAAFNWSCQITIHYTSSCNLTKSDFIKALEKCFSNYSTRRDLKSIGYWFQNGNHKELDYRVLVSDINETVIKHLRKKYGLIMVTDLKTQDDLIQSIEPIVTLLVQPNTAVRYTRGLVPKK